MSKQKSPERQLTQQQKRAEVRSRLILAPELSNRAIARQLNISHHVVEKVRQELLQAGILSQAEPRNDDWLKHPYLVANPDLLNNTSERIIRALKADGVLPLMQERNSLSAIYCQRLLHKQKKAAEEAAYVELTHSDIVLKCDDVLNGLSWIKPNSLDGCIVDPPYQASAVKSSSDKPSLYKAIAQVAERVLKPGGILVVMTGQSHFNKVVSDLDSVDGLVYHWLCTVLTLRGGSTMLPWLGACPYHKPVLIYIKGKRVWNRGIFTDVIEASPPGDDHRTLHHWQQDLEVFRKLVLMTTSKGDTVLDCTCGASTTGVACVQLGRRYIGVDIDVEAIQTSRERLAAALAEREHVGDGEVNTQP